MRRWWIVLILAPVLAYATARFCHMQTSGFKLTKVRDNFLLETEERKTHLPEELLLQPFTYLDRGLQSFSFLSEDHTTVLKLFNNRYQRKIFWFSLFPGTEKKVAYLKSKLMRIAKSYQLAFDELKEETQLLYLHLSPTTHLKKRITLIDKLNIAHEIDLDTCAFALQKKGTLAYTHLSYLMKQGRENEAKEAVRSIIELIVLRCKKGIADNDPLMRTNLGFVSKSPFFIDIGPFSKDPLKQNEVQKIAQSLHRWLEEHHPSLALNFDTLLSEAMRDE